MRTLATALVLAFVWANRAGCCWLAGHTPWTVQAPLPPGAARQPSTRPGALRVLAFGDFGDDTCQQAVVAKGMAGAHAGRPFDLALSLGDNIYECGPDPRLPGAADCAFAPDGNAVRPGYVPPDDPRFRKLFEAPLEPLVREGRAIPLWLTLGNHDQNSGPRCREGDLAPQELGRVRACLEVAHRAPHWRMPGRHYVVDEGPARFVFLDSNLIVGEYGGFTFADEVAFFREATRGCEARPCFVVAHHPPASAGGGESEGRPGPDTFQDRLRTLREAASGPVAGWFAGHDHDLQHVRTPAGLDVFVSGNGSRWRDEKFGTVRPAEARLFFASTAWGFAILEAWAGGWSVRFEDAAGTPLHCCQAAFPGACEPVACGPRLR
jgi:tartrate-resistant acid phosphatase type 5